MQVIKEIAGIREQLVDKDSVGLVATMGFLHGGHLSLVENALAENKNVVVSVFVNPTQFAPDEDYEDYPRNLEGDKEILAKMGVDFIFAPQADKMYSYNFDSHVEVRELSKYLCGQSRPHFFGGVATVVSKLFNIIKPDRAYFGQKDYQQYIIIKRMVRDLNFPVQIRRVPIVREEDGLAMSSRNEYLNEEEREAATVLYRSLNKGRELIEQGERDAEKVKKVMVDMIKQEEPATIDYVSIADPENLAPIETIEGSVLLAEAVFIGDTRLIDNQLVDLK